MLTLKQVTVLICLLFVWGASSSYVTVPTGKCPNRRDLTICEKQCTKRSCPVGQLCCKTKCKGKQCSCPEGVTLFNCLVDPCQFAKCPKFPDATCESDFCGGCKARFFVKKKCGGKREVTKKCEN